MPKQHMQRNDLISHRLSHSSRVCLGQRVWSRICSSRPHPDKEVYVETLLTRSGRLGGLRERSLNRIQTLFTEMIDLQGLGFFQKWAVQEDTCHERENMKNESINNYGNHRNFEGYVETVIDCRHRAFHDANSSRYEGDQGHEDSNGKAHDQNSRRNSIADCDKGKIESQKAAEPVQKYIDRWDDNSTFLSQHQ